MDGYQDGKAVPNMNWRGTHLLNRQFIIVIAIFVAISISMLGLSVLSLKLSHGIRGFIQGEGFWAKAQKDALYLLLDYSYTGDEVAYQAIQDALNVPLGDHLARQCH